MIKPLLSFDNDPLELAQTGLRHEQQKTCKHNSTQQDSM